MKEYSDQPEEQEPEESDTKTMDMMKVIISTVLLEDLPACSTNAWFIDSVDFANMLDRMMKECWENV